MKLFLFYYVDKGLNTVLFAKYLPYSWQEKYFYFVLTKKKTYFACEKNNHFK